MNKRQEILYAYLLDESAKGYINKSKIVKDLDNLYPRQYEINRGIQECNSHAFRQLRQDIVDLNNSGVAKIVVGNATGGYKLATAKEAAEQINRLRISALKKLKIASNMNNKLRSNYQTKATETFEIITIESVINAVSDNESV